MANKFPWDTPEEQKELDASVQDGQQASNAVNDGSSTEGSSDNANDAFEQFEVKPVKSPEEGKEKEQQTGSTIGLEEVYNMLTSNGEKDLGTLDDFSRKVSTDKDYAANAMTKYNTYSLMPQVVEGVDELSKRYNNSGMDSIFPDSNAAEFATAYAMGDDDYIADAEERIQAYNDKVTRDNIKFLEKQYKELSAAGLVSDDESTFISGMQNDDDYREKVKGVIAAYEQSKPRTSTTTYLEGSNDKMAKKGYHPRTIWMDGGKKLLYTKDGKTFYNANEEKVEITRNGSKEEKPETLSQAEELNQRIHDNYDEIERTLNMTGSIDQAKEVMMDTLTRGETGILLSPEDVDTVRDVSWSIFQQQRSERNSDIALSDVLSNSEYSDKTLKAHYDAAETLEDKAYETYAGWFVKRARSAEKEMQSEKGKVGWDGFLDSLWEGTVSGVKDVKRSALGFGDISEALLLKQAKEAYDNGTATDAQKHYLEAVTLATFAEAVRNQYTGHMFNMMKGQAPSAVFMAEFFVNKLGGLGKTAMAKTLKTLCGNRVSRNAIVRAILKVGNKPLRTALVKSLNGVQGLTENTIGATAMTATTGLPGVIGGTLKDKNGQIVIDNAYNQIADTGRIQFNGTKDAETSTVKAFFKNFGTGFFDRFTEGVGSHPKDLYKAGKAIFVAGKGGRKVLTKEGEELVKSSKGKFSKVCDFFSSMTAADYNGMIGEIRQRVKLGDFFEENYEEFVNSIFSGLMEGKGFGESIKDAASPDQLLETGLALIPMQVIFGVANKGAKMYTSSQYKKEMNNAMDGLNAAFGERGQAIRESIDNASPEELSSIITGVLQEKDTTPEKRKAVLDYAKALVKYQTAEDVDTMKMVSNGGSENQSASADAYTKGYDLNGQAATDAKFSMNVSQQRIRDKYELESGEDVDAMLGLNKDYSNAEQVLDEIDASERLSDEEKAMMKDYVTKRIQYNGMIDAVKDDIERQTKAAEEKIDGQSNEDGTVQQATMKNGQAVYITSGQVELDADGNVAGDKTATITVRDQVTGKVSMVPVSEIHSVNSIQSAEALKAEAANNIRMQIAQERASQIDGTLNFNNGDVYTLEDANGKPIQVEVLADNGNGTIQAYVNGAEITLSKDALQNMNNAYNTRRAALYDKAKAEEVKGAEAPVASATTEVPTTETPTAEADEEAPAAEPTALDKIPVGEDGRRNYEAVSYTDAYDALVEQLGEEGAIQVASIQKAKAERTLEEIKKMQPKGDTIEEVIAQTQAINAARAIAAKKAAFWGRVAGEKETRERAGQMAADLVEKMRNDREAEQNADPVVVRISELCGQLRTTQGEEKAKVVEELSKLIRTFAEVNGYDCKVYHNIDEVIAEGLLTGKDAKNAKTAIENGSFIPGFALDDGRVIVVADQCVPIDGETAYECILGTLDHESVHQDNKHDRQLVLALGGLIREGKVSYEEAKKIVERVSGSETYTELADDYDAKGRHDEAVDLIADELMAHLVQEKKLGLDPETFTKDANIIEITNRAYEKRENIRNSRAAAERSKTLDESAKGDSRTSREDNGGASRNGLSGSGGISKEVESAIQEEADKVLDGESGVVFGKDGNVILDRPSETGRPRFSVRTWKDGGRKCLEKYLYKQVKEKKFTKEEADNLLDEMDRLTKMAEKAADGNPNGLFSQWCYEEVRTIDGTSIPVLHAMKDNAEYSLNIDFSTVCKKRQVIDYLMNKMINDGYLQHEKLSSVDIARINQIIQKHGLEIACEICFVDARRYNAYVFAQGFLDKFNPIVQSLAPGRNVSGFNYSNDGSFTNDGKIDLSQTEEVVDWLAVFGSKNWKKALDAYDLDWNYTAGIIKPLYDKAVASVKADDFKGKFENWWYKQHEDAIRNEIVAEAKDAGKKGVTKKSITEKEIRKRVPKYTSADMLSKAFNDALSNANAEQKFAMSVSQSPAVRKLAKAEDFIASEGWTNIRQSNLELERLWNIQKGAAGAKPNEGNAQYLNDVLNKQVTTDIFDIGGYRMQSFSDFIGRMYFDYLQAFADLSAKQLPGHAYTKEPSFVKLFGMMGMKINMSLVAQVDNRLGKDYAGLTIDGNGNLVYNWNTTVRDSQGNIIRQGQTFPPEIAFELQQDPRYTMNAGTIAVGLSREHIKMMLADDSIRMVIPYHKSGLPHGVALVYHLNEVNDYTSVQNTRSRNGSLTDEQKKIMKKRVDNFNFVLHQLSIAKDRNAAYNALRQLFAYEDASKVDKAKRFKELYDAAVNGDHSKFKAWKDIEVSEDHHNENFIGKVAADIYLEACDQWGYIPKFDEFRGDHNYFKVLTDFALYDANGKYCAQEAIKFKVPDNVGEYIQETLAEDESIEAKKLEETNPIIQEIESYLDDTERRAEQDRIASKASDAVTAEEKAYMGENIFNVGDNRNAVEVPKVRLSVRKEQTKTAAFKEWFGDWENDPENASKVVDAEGKPLVVYHGTVKGGFNKFNKNGIGIFFTDNKAAVNDYAATEKGEELPEAIIKDFTNGEDIVNFIDNNGVEAYLANVEEYLNSGNLKNDYIDEVTPEDVKLSVENDHIVMTASNLDKPKVFTGIPDLNNYIDNTYVQKSHYPVYLDMKKPLVIDAKGEDWATLPRTVDGITLPSEYLAIEKNEGSTDEWAEYLQSEEGRKLGYDGIIVKNVTDSMTADTDDYTITDYLVFSPTQIKSATQNNGEFDGSNPDIRYRVRVTPEQDAEYMDAVKAGDMEKAQQMVNGAAKSMGYNSPMLYHGTNSFGFTQIETEGIEGTYEWSPFFATNKEGTAATYTLNGNKRGVTEALSDDDREKLIDERKAKITELVDKFRKLIDSNFSEWYFGYQDNSTIEDAVERANPTMGEGDGVYDVLSDIVYDAFHNYGEDFEDYESCDEWLESSEEGKAIIDTICAIEGEKSAIAEIESGEDVGGIYGMYANTDNLFVCDGKGAAWNALRIEGLPPLQRNGLKDAPYHTRDVALWARKKGYDGVLFKNIKDNGAYGGAEASDVYCFFNPQSQAKSADPVTYDDNGEVIPLSERFDEGNKDIRWRKRSRGVPYQGSKGQEADAIVSVLPSGKRFVDLFSGGGAVTDAALDSGKYEEFHMNDKYPIGQTLFLNAIDGKYHDYNRKVSAEEFDAMRSTPEGLMHSYNGYGLNVANNGKDGRDYQQGNIDRVRRLERFQSMRDKITSSEVDYRDVEIKDGDVLYADIPYKDKNVGAYKNAGKFDHKAFAEWASSLDQPVYVSSYEAPEGFTEIWKSSVPTSTGEYERLFVQDKFANSGVENDISVNGEVYNNADAAGAEEQSARFSIVKSKKLIKKFEEEIANGDYVVVYRAMVEVDGKIYPPMASMEYDENGKKVMVGEVPYDVWMQSDENLERGFYQQAGKGTKTFPYGTQLRQNGQEWEALGEDGKWYKLSKGKKEDMVDINGDDIPYEKMPPALYFMLYKDNGTTCPARYNPYNHVSATPLNDQFKSAWNRPNMVVVKTLVPKSELESGYKAEGAKNKVGMVDWKSGAVGAVLNELGIPRQVALTRYCKVVGKLTDEESARMIAERIHAGEAMLGGVRIPIPVNTVTPSLLKELEKLGLEIGEPESNSGKVPEGYDMSKYTSPTLAVKKARSIRKKVKKNEEKAEKKKQLEKEAKALFKVRGRRHGIEDYPMRSENATKEDVKEDIKNVFGISVNEPPSYGSRVSFSQEELNNIYDALRYIAITADISPNAMSLGGELYMKKKVRGGNDAEYWRTWEGDDRYIAFDYKQGVNAIAHEWMHALDNWLDGNARKENGTPRPFAYQLSTNGGAVRPKLVQAMKDIFKAMKTSGFDARLKEFVSEQNWYPAYKSYIKRKEEKLARCMDVFMRDKGLEALAVGEINSAYEMTHPNAEEMKVIAPALQNFFNTLQEKTDKKGNTILYRQRGVKSAAAADVLDKLNTDAVLDTAADIPENEEKNAKVWYDAQGGKLHVVPENCFSANDAKKTLLYESVAHYGLENVVGRESLNKFLDRVYMGNQEVRKAVNKIIPQYGYQYKAATEEFCARLAEQEVPMAIWTSVRSAFKNMLKKLGIDVRLRDNEILYMLWKTKRSLNGDDVFEKANDIAKQMELGSGVRYAVRTPLANAQSAYNEKTGKNWLHNREQTQDSMISVKVLQEAVAQETGKEIGYGENAYLAENRMHGTNKNECEYFDDNFYEPLSKAINNLMESAHMGYKDVEDYVIMKHGIERNAMFGMRKALEDLQEKAKVKAENAERRRLDINNITDPKEKAKAEASVLKAGKEAAEMMKKTAWANYLADADLVKLKKDYAEGNIDYREYETKRRDILERHIPGTKAQIEAIGDKAGLTQTTGEETDFEDAAFKAVVDIEKDNKEACDELWKRTNAATGWTLRKGRESGRMTKESYDYVASMFDFYVPLRGWNDTNADEVYKYMNAAKPSMNPTLKKMKGRTSRADGPFGYIGSMAASEIVLGNKNLYLQYFYRMAINHPTSLLAVSEMWYENTGTAEVPSWKEVAPNLTAGMTVDEIHTELARFNAEMEAKKRNGLATKTKQGFQIEYPLTQQQKGEHMVKLQVDGKDIVIFINGNPKAAQALNGINKAKGAFESTRDINQQIGQFLTSLNASFVPANFMRDMLGAEDQISIKESASYVARFNKNAWKILRPRATFGGGMMPKLLHKYKNGTLDDNNEMEHYFKLFMQNGGETGYVAMLTNDAFEKDIEKKLQRLGHYPIHKRVWTAFADSVEFLNRAVEDATRFTAFVTSMQEGKPLEQSIDDAKNISLNFNRSGAGGELKFDNKQLQWMSDHFLPTTATMRNHTVFINPAIQDLQILASLITKHPVRFTMLAAWCVSIGLAQPWLNSLLGGDEEEYWKIPKWVRRNNFIIRIPTTNTFIKIPLPQGFRMWNGLGESIASHLAGKDDSNAVAELGSNILGLMPVDPTGNGGNPMVMMAPTWAQGLAQASVNENFLGYPIFKENQGNEYYPEAQRVSVGTPNWMIAASEGLNELTGGDKYMKGAVEGAVGDDKYMRRLTNPSVINHLMNSWFGGVWSFGSGTIDMAYNAASGKGVKVTTIPIASRFIAKPKDKEEGAKLPDYYYDLIKEADKTMSHRKGWKKDAKNGDEKADEMVDKIEDSKAFERAETIRSYDNDIQKLKKEMDDTETQEERDLIINEISMLVEELNDELKAIDEDFANEEKINK